MKLRRATLTLGLSAALLFGVADAWGWFVGLGSGVSQVATVATAQGSFTCSLDAEAVTGAASAATYSCANGFSFTLEKGDTGDTGEQGPVGATGAEGPRGDDGPMGAQGESGPAGADGPVGPTGLTGPAGATGPTGAQGIQGPQGVAGAAGPAGANGVSGLVFVSVDWTTSLAAPFEMTTQTSCIVMTGGAPCAPNQPKPTCPAGKSVLSAGIGYIGGTGPVGSGTKFEPILNIPHFPTANTATLSMTVQNIGGGTKILRAYVVCASAA